jgi:hypothetical protein
MACWPWRETKEGREREREKKMTVIFFFKIIVFNNFFNFIDVSKLARQNFF